MQLMLGVISFRQTSVQLLYSINNFLPQIYSLNQSSTAAVQLPQLLLIFYLNLLKIIIYMQDQSHKARPCDMYFNSSAWVKYCRNNLHRNPKILLFLMIFLIFYYISKMLQMQSTKNIVLIFIIAQINYFQRNKDIWQ